MGKATILSNLGDGLYEVRQDVGTAERNALLLQFNNQKIEIENNIAEQNIKISNQENEVAAKTLPYNEASNALAAFSADLNTKIVNKRSEINSKEIEKQNKEIEIQNSRAIIDVYNQQIYAKQEEFNNKSEQKLDIEELISELEEQQSIAETNVNTITNEIQVINQDIDIDKAIIETDFANLELLLELNNDQYTDKIVYFIENILDYLDISQNQAFYFNNETSRYNSIGQYNIESIGESKAGSLYAANAVNAFSNAFTNFALDINQPSNNFLQSLQNVINDLDQAINLFGIESQINQTEKNQIYNSAIQLLNSIQNQFNLTSNLWQKQKDLSSVYFVPIEIHAQILRRQKEIENINVELLIISADIQASPSNNFFTDNIDFYEARKTEALENSQAMPDLFDQQEQFFNDAYDVFDANVDELIAIIDGEL